VEWELRRHASLRGRALKLAPEQGGAGWHPGERALSGSHPEAAPAGRQVWQGPAPRLRGESARVLRAVAADGSGEIRTASPDASCAERCAHHRARLVQGDVVAQSSLAVARAPPGAAHVRGVEEDAAAGRRIVFYSSPSARRRLRWKWISAGSFTRRRHGRGGPAASAGYAPDLGGWPRRRK